MFSQTNALAEIALALAMAFFSIMVLTMVSMGAVQSAQSHGTLTNPNSVHFKKSQPKSHSKQTKAHQKRMTAKDMVIFYKGKFFDSRLEILEKVELKNRQIKILAVDPSLPSSEAIELRSLFVAEDLTLTVLSPDWLKSLKENIR